jgi:Ca-activated chloride channel family protein
LLAGLEPGGRQVGGGHWLQRLLLTLVWLICVAAAARPQWVGEPVQLPAAGRDLLLAVDISGSMEIADMVLQNRNLQRIDVVKLVVGDFVQRRQNDRLGLILFGSNAYLQAPLTFDRTTVNTLLQEAQLGFAGQQTAIGDAIGLAIKRLRERPEASRVLILLTDGANTAGEVEPRHAADLAKLAGVKIYTIGVGAEEMIQQTLFGRRRVNPSADLDEGTLQYIADHTGGTYFRARNPEELVQIYAELDKLEPIELDEEVFRPVAALFHWFLGAALLLSFLLAMLRLDLPGALRQGGASRNAAGEPI